MIKCVQISNCMNHQGRLQNNTCSAEKLKIILNDPEFVVDKAKREKAVITGDLRPMAMTLSQLLLEEDGIKKVTVAIRNNFLAIMLNRNVAKIKYLCNNVMSFRKTNSKH